ncbi:TetR/AcrR family transcriptional regulator [Hyphomonas atlantica]|uniref:HTH tetR-type domain-containing protein n=1 Tax=Hyphomonas atlantica TaxID=1280948 RepID=A0A059E9L1_9PROT|nr:TetR/AcrR family transcriptional regulator [Hyphomonas atlantica]KCZ64614.1 hypothetical protein HY36_12275 [Hyphomonas atlantica]MAN66953.1 TetR/AcrR family transcriptional regulator [Hyphomonadaceae bacterium]MBA27645.1 TetR/AcrR family transcriptional regulator [Hyphomonadaceae bacterium]|tara:strand:+ start:20564 stop:21298 length:735 start_codon:yes stop_codon:yes gene_type:complete
MADYDDLNTRNRIKVSARRLFAERGVEAVTVREIVAASGAKNGGSLNYYFKSKEGLILELLAEIFRESSDGWLIGLSELEKKGGPDCVRDVVEVLVRWPDTATFTDPSPTASRFLSSLLFTRRHMVRDFLEQMNFSVFARLLAYIQLLQSDIPPVVMQQRLIYFAWYIMSSKAAYESYQATGRRNTIWTEFDPMENLIDTASALIEAPCTRAEITMAGSTNAKSAGGRRRQSAMLQALDAALPR